MHWWCAGRLGLLQERTFTGTGVVRYAATEAGSRRRSRTPGSALSTLQAAGVAVPCIRFGRQILAHDAGVTRLRLSHASAQPPLSVTGSAGFRGRRTTPLQTPLYLAKLSPESRVEAGTPAGFCPGLPRDSARHSRPKTAFYPARRWWWQEETPLLIRASHRCPDGGPLGQESARSVADFRRRQGETQASGRVAATSSAAASAPLCRRCVAESLSVHGETRISRPHRMLRIAGLARRPSTSTARGSDLTLVTALAMAPLVRRKPPRAKKRIQNDVCGIFCPRAISDIRCRP